MIYHEEIYVNGDITDEVYFHADTDAEAMEHAMNDACFADATEWEMIVESNDCCRFWAHVDSTGSARDFR